MTVGQTVVSPTVQSHTIEQDADVDVKAPFDVGVASAAFNSFGTGPSLVRAGKSGGAVRLRVQSGTGTPAIADNNVVVTLANTTRTPRKVFLAASLAAPRFCVTSVGAGTVTIGTKVAPAASTVYELELIVLF